MAGGLTFMDSDDVGVVEGRHDLDLSPDVDKVLLILDFVFPDGFDGHLQTNTHTHTAVTQMPGEDTAASHSPLQRGSPPLFWEGAL